MWELWCQNIRSCVMKMPLESIYSKKRLIITPTVETWEQHHGPARSTRSASSDPHRLDAGRGWRACCLSSRRIESHFFSAPAPHPQSFPGHQRYFGRRHQRGDFGHPCIALPSWRDSSSECVGELSVLSRFSHRPLGYRGERRALVDSDDVRRLRSP